MNVSVDTYVFLELNTTNIYKWFKIICLLNKIIILIPQCMETVRLVGR